MYIEFILLILDYFATINKRIIIYEWLIPFIIGITSYYFSWKIGKLDLYEFIEETIGFIATLLGFTLAALTLFLTCNSQLEKSKEFITDKKIRGKKISLHRLLIVNYSYLIIVESILCICFYIGKLFSIFCSPMVSNILNSLFIFFLFHILLMTIRIITDLYFVISKE